MVFGVWDAGAVRPTRANPSVRKSDLFVQFEIEHSNTHTHTSERQYPRVEDYACQHVICMIDGSSASLVNFPIIPFRSDPKKKSANIWRFRETLRMGLVNPVSATHLL